MNILLTGAGRGLGFEICKTLLNKGYCVYAANRTFTDELRELSKKFDGKLFFKSVDFSDPKKAASEIFAEDFITNKIVICGFVNNAAIAYDDIVSNLNYEKLEEMYKVNVLAPMMITKAVLRNMIFHHTAGSLVHISSVSAHTGYKGLAMYASTKGALEAFSLNLAREWGVRKIRSNCVACGFMNTQMSSTLSDEQRQRIYARTSLKSETDKTSVAETVEFLLSERSQSITAQTIRVDCGV